MRLLVIADIEDLRWKHGVGEADILLSCGDVSDHVIMEAADAFKCHAIFAVKGTMIPSIHFPSRSWTSVVSVKNAWVSHLEGSMEHGNTSREGITATINQK